MTKIMLVLNNPNREMSVMEAIKNEIIAIRPDSQVNILEMCTPTFNEEVIKFKPDVILTFPFTCVGFSKWYYIFKLLHNSKLISYRAEGIADYASEYNIEKHVGYDKYGKNLVDYEVFWGCKMADVVGQALVSQGKLSSALRVKYTGYPRLEHYFQDRPDYSITKLPVRIKQKIEMYSKNDIILIVTGFHLANYTKNDLFNARDLDAENRCDELLAAVILAKLFRQEWIDNIIKTAMEHPRQLFVVKKHPNEKKNDYEVFDNITNVCYIHEDIEVNDLMSLAGLFCHYGSTTLVDSYLTKIPSIYLHSENKVTNTWFPDMGWPSSRAIPISSLSAGVAEYINKGLTFDAIPAVKQVLKDMFNIEEGKPYHPSREIAELILNQEPPQKIPLNDIYLWKSLVLVTFEFVLRRMILTVKKILGMSPQTPLLRW